MCEHNHILHNWAALLLSYILSKHMSLHTGRHTKKTCAHTMPFCETEMQLEWSIRKHRIAHVASFSPKTDQWSRSITSKAHWFPCVLQLWLSQEWGTSTIHFAIPLINTNRSANFANRCALSVEQFNASLIKSCAFACRMVQNIQNKGQHYPSPSLHKTVISTRPYTMWRSE